MTHLKRLLTAVVLGSAAFLILAPAASAQRGNRPGEVPPRLNPQFLAAFREVTTEASKCTVRVLCDDKEAALGTIVGPDGWILTKYSLLSGKVSCKLKDGRTLAAKIVGIHEAFDLAMLKVEATDLPAARLTESKVAPVGNWVVSVGTGADPVAVGVMSVASRNPPPVVLRRPPTQQQFVNPMAALSGVRTFGMLSAPLGAPLLAASSLYPRRGFGYGGRGGDLLGVFVTPDANAAKVTRVIPQSAAARAGLKVDDKILSIQGHAITDQNSLRAVLGRMRPGDTVTIKLLRGGKEMELKATLQGRQFRRPDQNQMGSELSQRRTGFPTYFQSDTVIKPKDCGGPVCDLDGHIIGINIARAGRVESYSIPAEALRPLLADLMSGELSPKRVAIAALEKKIAELKTSLKTAETDKAAADKKFQEARDALKKQEADRAAAEKKWKEMRDALDKAEKELKQKK
jgi:serine protease Do